MAQVTMSSSETMEILSWLSISLTLCTEILAYPFLSLYEQLIT
jgi:hypothetical protein